jgi:hypothetical protein
MRFFKAEHSRALASRRKRRTKTLTGLAGYSESAAAPRFFWLSGLRGSAHAPAPIAGPDRPTGIHFRACLSSRAAIASVGPRAQSPRISGSALADPGRSGSDQHRSGRSSDSGMSVGRPAQASRTGLRKMPTVLIWFRLISVLCLLQAPNHPGGTASLSLLQKQAVAAERPASRGCDFALPHLPSPVTMGHRSSSQYSSCCPPRSRLPYSCLPRPDRGEAWYPVWCLLPLPSVSLSGRRDCLPKGGEGQQSRIWNASSFVRLELTASPLVGQRPCHTGAREMQLTSH